MPEGWVLQTAAEFWAAVGGERYPRDVLRAAPWALPVGVVRVPALSLATVAEYLRRLEVGHPVPRGQQGLHGCVVAHGGRGLILINEDDTEDEQRFTGAHEVAHFIADYLEPRRASVESVGRAALDVLDGVRAPSLVERLRAVLAGQRLRAYVHLTRAQGGEPDAESRADRLAVELLAPEGHALAALEADPAAAPALVLRAAYGLPAAVAARYARWLRPPVTSQVGGWLLRPVRGTR